jgi:hypothetical protein
MEKLADVEPLRAVAPEPAPQPSPADQAAGLLCDAFLKLTVLVETYQGKELAEPAERARKELGVIAATLLIRDKVASQQAK